MTLGIEPCKAIQFACLAVLLGLGSSVAQAANEQSDRKCAAEIALLRSTLAIPPVQAARQAAASGDLKYFEVFGYTSVLPAVTSAICARDEGAAKPLEGTTDAICNAEHRQLIVRSKSYAAAYNQQVHLERKARGLKSCGAD